MAVPYTFGSATTSIPLSQLDSNFATTITLGNTAIQLGNTVTTLNNMTLANVTISSGTSSITSNSISNGTSNVTVNSSGGNITLGTAGTTAVTIDTSQNVGIGVTPSAWGSAYKALQIGGGASGSFLNFQAPSQLISFNAYYNGSNYVYQSSNYAGISDFNGSSVGGFTWRLAASGTAGNTPSFTQAMTLDSSGNLLVGRTSASGSEKLSVYQSASDWASILVTANATQYYGLRITSATTKNDTSSLLYDGLDNGNLRFRVYSNGGIANYSANNSNLSDQREKKDIELAPSYLDKICAIPIKTFFYNDQTDTDKNLGVIAQDVQAVAPELVAETDWSENGNGSKMRLSIYQTDLQYALMKAIQELKAINDTQAETINALTARIVALEAK